MTENKDLLTELRSIVEEIAKLDREQKSALDEKWGEDRYVPDGHYDEYDSMCWDHLEEDAELLIDVHRRLARLIEPLAAA
ncbi:hypothetical protein ABZ419_09905 [Streptomyces cinnamoneus]|uniref:hypothetical protein n=1 Tax=Streptomyces cinnamoneus TaxID=53446 RepID=UPI00340931D8